MIKAVAGLSKLKLTKKLCWQLLLIVWRVKDGSFLKPIAAASAWAQTVYFELEPIKIEPIKSKKKPLLLIKVDQILPKPVWQIATRLKNKKPKDLLKLSN